MFSAAREADVQLDSQMMTWLSSISDTDYACFETASEAYSRKNPTVAAMWSRQFEIQLRNSGPSGVTGPFYRSPYRKLLERYTWLLRKHGDIAESLSVLLAATRGYSPEEAEEIQKAIDILYVLYMRVFKRGDEVPLP